ncbi:ARM repeat-containing protein [Serendipita vermifera]|nr:ARM repeat-containing protein [Serendipita vermifera]
MSVLPNLSPQAIHHSTLLVLRATTLIHTSVDPPEQQQRQHELAQIVNSPDAWGLVIPFLEHEDVNVQFYGAHIAGVKIVRDWNSISEDLQLPLRDTVLQLTGQAIVLNRPKLVLRRLYVAITALALKLTIKSPPKWPDFLTYSLSYLQTQGASRESLLEFMTIAVEEVQRAPRSTSNQISHALTSAIPAFMETFAATVTSHSNPESERLTALKCLQAWVVWGLPGNDLFTAIPTLLSILSDPSLFIHASDVLQDILSSSALADGSGVKTLSLPLLTWISTTGRTIADSAVEEGMPNPISSSFCKLLCALGDHSNIYIASKLSSPSKIPSTPGGAAQFELDPQVKEFLRLMLLYTGFPGWYGIDEQDSEMTLSFWYLLQESLWEVGEGGEDDDEWAEVIEAETGKAIQNAIDEVNRTSGIYVEDEDPMRSPIQEANPKHKKIDDSMNMAKILFREVVGILKRKVTWPTAAQMQASGGWDAEQRETFGIYRRNVGDTLINACYVLRHEFLETMINDIRNKLSQIQSLGSEHSLWEDVEATLFCIKAVHDALPPSDLHQLEFLFDESTMAALPQDGAHRVRWTMLTLIGEYATYFSASSSIPSLLRAVSYTVSALPEPSLSLQASMTLRELCDANRATLAPHLNSFADLHRNVERLGAEEKSKVLESIASVISAMHPAASIAPVEAIIQPLLTTLAQSFNLMALEQAQAGCINQLRSLTGCARGLTVVSDPLEETFIPDQSAIVQARLDPRMVKLRDDVVTAIRTVADRWWSDAEITSALSELIKAITATPSEESILSLPPQPLLQIISDANRRQVSSTWLTLATILVGQLHPPKTLETLNPVPSAETIKFVEEVTPLFFVPCLDMMNGSEVMEANPDIVQEFFRFSEAVAHYFLQALYRLPQQIFSSLLLHAIVALSLQERYSLVGSCRFLLTLLRDTFSNGDLTRETEALMEIHGKQIVSAVLYGVASVAPRSTIQNLSELLHCLVSKQTQRTRTYVNEVLFSSDFTLRHPMATQESKERFTSALMAARSGNKARLAITEFQNVTRGAKGEPFRELSLLTLVLGLEGASFGYVTV